MLDWTGRGIGPSNVAHAFSSIGSIFKAFKLMRSTNKHTATIHTKKEQILSWAFPMRGMHAIQGQVALAREHGLFKAASASQVLWHLLLVVTGNSELGVSQHDSLPVVTKVDFFISHSWSCPSWIKFLALCHQLNFDLAIASSLFACLLATTFLIFWCGNVTGVAQHTCLLQALVLPWPTAVFFTTYFSGHLLKSRASFWIDQVCVHQRNLLMKTQTLQALPGIIAQSAQMLVVWDEIYFQRLWCIYAAQLDLSHCFLEYAVSTLFFPATLTKTYLLAFRRCFWQKLCIWKRHLVEGAVERSMIYVRHKVSSLL